MEITLSLNGNQASRFPDYALNCQEIKDLLASGSSEERTIEDGDGKRIKARLSNEGWVLLAALMKAKESFETGCTHSKVDLHITTRNPGP